MVFHCYGLMAKRRKCANSPVLKGADMDLERYISIAVDHALAFTSIVSNAVSSHIFGGWWGILAFAAFALTMFILTTLLYPRR
jgi:hypothetical protein